MHDLPAFRRYLPLICLSLIHAIVDACALLIAPLWPQIESTYALGVAGLSAAFIVQSLPTNVSQLVFGLLRDRRPMPFWVWAGPIGAAIFLPLMGQATSAVALFSLLAIGGIAVGAFHPEAAVAAGRMLPESRTRALSIFLLGGTLGMSIGPLASGFVVPRWGLPGLAMLIPFLLACIGALIWIGGLGHALQAAPSTSPVTRGSVFGGRGRLALLVLFVCSLRLVPNMAMDKVLSFLLERRGADIAEIGRLQSLFLASTCFGMFLMAVWFRPGRERLILIASPLIGIPIMWTLSRPDLPMAAFIPALLLHGIVLWGTTPAMVSYAQQQFPNGAGFASALTMGFSWGVAGLIHAPLTAYFNGIGNPGGAFLSFTPFLALSAIGAWLLPRTPAKGVGPDVSVEPALPDAKPRAVAVGTQAS